MLTLKMNSHMIYTGNTKYILFLFLEIILVDSRENEALEEGKNWEKHEEIGRGVN